MINEIRYDYDIKKVDFSLPTIFLMGPTVRGNQTHLRSWRFDAVDIFKKLSFSGNIIIPEFISLTESDQYRYDIPLWEYHGLCYSTVNMCWLPRTRELIGLTTNHEIGYWMARERNKLVYGRPDNAFRIKYIDIMWEKDLERTVSTKIENQSIYSTLEDTIKASITLSNKIR